MKKKVFSKSMAWLLSVMMIFGLFVIVPLTATAISPSDVAQIAIDAAKVEQAIQWAIDIANDDSHGYGGGWGPEYDCSSFVISAFKSAGIDTGNATYTQNMVPEMTAKNFTYISWSDLGGKSGLQRGDILWRQNPGHTEIYIGNNQQVGSHQDLDGKKGDSSGKEISVQEYYEGGGGWDGILRYGLGGGGSYTTSYNPQGVLDCIDSPEPGKLHVRGWAFDKDDPNTQIEVHVYVGGIPGSGAPGYGIVANTERPDVNAAYSVGDYHGFDATFDVSPIGTQTVYLYAINIGGGNNVHIGSATVNIAEKISDIYVPVMQEAYVDNVTPYGFRLNAKVSDNVGVSRVEFETWKDGSPLRKTYVAQSIGNDMYIYDVNIADLTDEAGVYHSIVHAYDPSNNHSTAEIYIIVPDKDTVAPTITDVTISQVTSKGYRVTCRVSDNVGVTSVRFPTWTDNNGQDDLIWHDGTILGNIATCYVNASEHNNETGIYITHIYAYDAAGNNHSVSTGGINVTDEPLAISSTIYEGHKYIVYNSGMNWTQAKQWCEQNGGYLACTTTEPEWNAVKELLKKYNGVNSWLGGRYNSDSWEWITGEPFDFTVWGSGQPDRTGGIEPYIGTWGGWYRYIDGYVWNDYSESAYDVGGFVFEKEITPDATGNYNGHTYEYYSDTMNWWKAYRFCEKKGGHLVTINSQGENDFLLGMTNAQVEGVWLGGKTDSNHEIWHWITGELFDYQNWDTGEPNNVNQDAIHMYILGNGKGKWDDLASSDTQNCGFICEYDNEVDGTKYEPVYKENYNGHEYWFFENTVDWQTAKEICKAKGGHLVIIDNSDENSMVLSGIQKTSTSQAWIGATDIAEEGVWRDVNGNSLTYTNWHSSQPDNWNGNVEEDYALMWDGGTWNDCSSFGAIISDVGFVCEFDDLCTGSGHDYKLISTVEPTCTTNGKKVYTCTRCGDTKTVIMEALDHSYTETVVEPTCTERGYTLHTCANCSDSYKDTYTDPLGHDYEEKVIAPTTASQGYTLYTCKRCGHSYKDNYTDLLFANTTTLEATSIEIGGSVNINAFAEGGMAPYKFTVKFKKDGSQYWTLIQEDSENNAVNFKPESKGVYAISVTASDSSGKTETKSFEVTVKEPAAPLAIEADVAETLTLGDTMTITVKGSGGTGGYTYGVYYKKATSETWSTVQPLTGTSTSIALKPTAAVKYDVCVKVRDTSGKIEKKYFTVIVIKKEVPLTNDSTISKTSISLGDNVTITTKAAGGTGSYTYAAYYKKASVEKWTTAQAFKENAIISFKPGAAVKYDVCVKVKDSKGTIAKQYFTVTVTKELVNSSIISAETVKKGSGVTVTAKATGGTGKYTYGIYYKKAASEKWTTAQSYGTNTTVTIKPAAAVKYDICVKVKDSSGKIVKKYFTLTVTK